MPWLDPFAAVLGFVPALLHYLASGSLLTYLYFIKDDESTRLMSLCWIVVLVVWWLYIQRLKKYEKVETSQSSKTEP
jgi:uncharacterized membrane protein YdjX (TVP38/TMEM64 family)